MSNTPSDEVAESMHTARWPKFSIRQMLFGVTLIAIVLALFRSNWFYEEHAELQMAVFSPDGKELICSGVDWLSWREPKGSGPTYSRRLTAVRRQIFRVSTRDGRRTVMMETSGPTAGNFGGSPDLGGPISVDYEKGLIYVVSLDGRQIRLHGPGTIEKHEKTQPTARYIDSICVSGGDCAVATDGYGNVLYGRTDNARNFALLLPHTANIEWHWLQKFESFTSRSFAPNEPLFVIGSGETLLGLNCETGEQVDLFRYAAEDRILNAKFIDNGNLLVCHARGLSIVSRDGEVLKRIATEHMYLDCQITPSNEFAVVLRDDFAVEVFTLKSGEKIRQLQCPKARSISISPDGVTVAVCHWNAELSLHLIYYGDRIWTKNFAPPKLVSAWWPLGCLAIWIIAAFFPKLKQLALTKIF